MEKRVLDGSGITNWHIYHLVLHASRFSAQEQESSLSSHLVYDGKVYAHRAVAGSSVFERDVIIRGVCVILDHVDLPSRK